MKKKILAIIPARAGSKRLRDKNIIGFGGKPMIAWTIKAARESGLFSRVFVSTDSQKIADIAIRSGATVPFLREGNADDYTPVGAATIDALIKMEDYEREDFDLVVQLMANCPCRTRLDITNAYRFFNRGNLSFLISVFKFGWMNPWWALKVSGGSGNQAKALFPEAFKKRSQDLGDLYCPSGAIWMAKSDALKREKTFYGKNYSVFPLSWQNALDIDTIDDLKLAEAVLHLRKKI